MTVGVNSYVSIAEADEIVRLRFKRLDEFRVYWEALDEDGKESYLVKSAEQIDTLIFTGRKTDPCQPMQFPRNFERTIPQNVKTAAVYNALGFMNEDLNAVMHKQITSLQSLGALINLRESGATSRATIKNAYEAEAAFAGTTTKKTILCSRNAETLLKPYTRGSFSIR